MAVKINGKRVEGKLTIVGKTYHFAAEEQGYSFGLSRSDKCELELAAHMCDCTVISTHVKSGYGKSKQAVVVLRVDIKREKN